MVAKYSSPVQRVQVRPVSAGRCCAVSSPAQTGASGEWLDERDFCVWETDDLYLPNNTLENESVKGSTHNGAIG